jgi:hypothetical protein
LSALSASVSFVGIRGVYTPREGRLDLAFTIGYEASISLLSSQSSLSPQQERTKEGRRILDHGWDLELIQATFFNIHVYTP